MRNSLADAFEDGRDVCLEFLAEGCASYARVKQACGDSDPDDWRRGCGDRPDFLHDFALLSADYVNQLARLGTAYSSLACRGLEHWCRVMRPSRYDPPPAGGACGNMATFAAFPGQTAVQRMYLTNPRQTAQTFLLYPATIEVNGKCQALTTHYFAGGIKGREATLEAPVEFALKPFERHAVSVQVGFAKDLPAGDYEGMLSARQANGRLMEKPILATVLDR